MKIEDLFNTLHLTDFHQEMATSQEVRLRNLRGAVCDYLDEGLIEEFYKDLRAILDEEEKDFITKASRYIEVRNALFNGNK